MRRRVENIWQGSTNGGNYRSPLLSKLAIRTWEQIDLHKERVPLEHFSLVASALF